MKIKFEFEVEIPEDPVQLATDVYRHIYEDDYDDDDSINNALYNYIIDVVENADYSEQLPIKYVKTYDKTLNKLKNNYVY